MIMRVALSILGLLLCGVTSATIDGRDRSQERPAAAALWERTIQAKGGRERLHGVQALAIKTPNKPPRRGAQEPTSFEMVQLLALPDKSFAWVDARPLFDLRVHMFNPAYSGRPYWNSEDRVVRQENPDWEMGRLREAQLIYLLETQWASPSPLTAVSQKFRSRRVQILETTCEKDSLKYYLDPSTDLPFRIEWHTLGLRTTDVYELRDYVDVGGIKLPSVVTKTDVWGPLTQHKYFEINPKYDPTVFERPPNIDDGPFVWRETQMNRR